MNHTPGPWYVSRHDGFCDVWKDFGDCRELIASADDGWEEAEANARLIAAAPELLSVVEDLMESAEYWGEYDVPLGIVDRMRAAIEKARANQ